MTIRKLKFSPLAAAAAIALWAMPMHTMAGESGSDRAFDEMIGTMAGHDTGSAWFEYYVEVLNQDIAYRQAAEAFGAAGPNGPLGGFDGYVSGFMMPDTGSRSFNRYVDELNRVIQEKQRYE